MESQRLQIGLERNAYLHDAVHHDRRRLSCSIGWLLQYSEVRLNFFKSMYRVVSFVPYLLWKIFCKLIPWGGGELFDIMF